MTAPSARRTSHRHRRRTFIEPLESRTLLAVQPLATPSSFTVITGQPFTAAVYREYLSLNGVVQDTWTTADATLTASHQNVWLAGHQGTTNGFVVDFRTADSHTGHFQFALPSSAPVAPASYPFVAETGAPPPEYADMIFAIDGQPQTDAVSHFTIRQVAVDASGTLTRFAVDFGQYSNIDGSLEWHTPANALSDGTPLTLSLASSPAHGTLSFHPDGSFTYTPTPGFVGTDSFTYTASDGTTTSAPVAATLTVANPNRAPSFTPGPNVTATSDAGLQSFPNWATHLSPGPSPADVGQALSFSVDADSNPSLFSQPPAIDSTGNLTFIPAPGATGTATLSVTLHDSGGTIGGGQDASAPASVTVTITIAPPSVQFTGYLINVYDGSGHLPLVGRSVFDDANNNGALDPGESTAITNLSGAFTLSLPAGNHTIRPVPVPGWTTPAGYADSGAASSSPPTGLRLYTTMAAPVVIDVLAVHPGSATPDDARLPWDGDIIQAFEVANWVFANSDTNVRLRLVADKTVSFTPSSTSLDADLNHLVATHDGVLDTVPKLRDSLKADLAIVFDPRIDAANHAGVAKLLDPSHPNADYGYAVVVASADAYATGLTLAHEVGHTLGADHDPQNNPKTKVAYAHGYRFTAGDGTTYRDVMAYAPGISLPFFSNPDLSYAGHALGDRTTANAARVVRENSYAVASYRGPAVLFPLDLPATTVKTATTAAKPGAAFTATATVRNDAHVKFTGKIEVDFYLSSDKILDVSDTLLTKKTLAARDLNPKATLSTSATVRLAAKTPAGTYYILAVAAPTGQPVDVHAARPKPVAAALKVAAAPKKTAARAKVTAAGFRSVRPVVEQTPAAERRSDDAEDVITGMLRSPR